jgi:hypothetical protein
LDENKSEGPNSPEGRWPTCAECKRLWNVYALATLDAMMAKEAAAQQDDAANAKTLDDKALEATQWWELARKAIRDHEATHAGEKP